MPWASAARAEDSVWTAVGAMEDPSDQEQTDSTFPYPEEHETSTNSVALPGVEGQEQAARAFYRHKKEHPGMDGGDGEESRKKEPRSVTGDDRGVLKTEEQQEELPVESKAREAPCASTGHA
ncbi:hypothetical protein NDU88_007740 [Pleurodeles waltl]|uniref:Uncharacterized protein n=1 Tax=Pleurodeles waltl TaxID=8319 RepID=A0AAV7N7R7_PLEWA|nr:hypothetical protein NDU88_007740 [Pleurodeles waltl]